MNRTGSLLGSSTRTARSTSGRVPMENALNPKHLNPPNRSRSKAMGFRNTEESAQTLLAARPQPVYVGFRVI